MISSVYSNVYLHPLRLDCCSCMFQCEFHERFELKFQNECESVSVSEREIMLFKNMAYKIYSPQAAGMNRFSCT